MRDKGNPTENGETKPTVFVGFDGEGYWDVDRQDHIYDMMKLGNLGIGSPGSYVTHLDFFRAVASVGDAWIEKGYTPIIVGYFINYDLTQVTRSLPDYELKWLADRKSRLIDLPTDDDYPMFKKSPTSHRSVRMEFGDTYSPDRYRMDWMQGKWATVKWPIRETLPQARAMQDESKIKWRSIKIVDVGSAFGGAFLKTVESWLGDELTEYERGVIKAGKAERGHEVTQAQRAADYPRIDKYNQTEIELLERLMVKFWITMDKTLGGDETLTKEIDGPGCIAAHWLDLQAGQAEYATALRENNKRIKTAEREGETDVDLVDVPETALPTGWDLAETIGPEAYSFVNDSYFGGWFETMRFGFVRDTYEYDLNSAYPAVIRDLPSLVDANAIWTTDERELFRTVDDGDLAWAEVTVYGANDKIGPCMYRDGEGHVTRPRDARVIINVEELAASIDAGLVDDYEIHRGLVIELPNRDVKPLAAIARLYEHRKEVGKNTPEGLADKLLMNSAYGKLCQSVGCPRWAQPIYAALITSRTRIQITNAIGSHPDGTDAVVSVATDAVFFDSPHDDLWMDKKELGAWDEEYFGLAYFVQSGVWGAATIKDGAAIGVGDVDMDKLVWDVKTRGMSAKAFRSELETSILPVLLESEREGVWPEDFTFHTRETFSMVSLPEAYTRGNLDKSGSFEVGEHGTPEVMRELSLRVTPKRMNPVWAGNGFESSAPLMPSLLRFGDTLSASRKDTIGGVIL